MAAACITKHAKDPLDRTQVSVDSFYMGESEIGVPILSYKLAINKNRVVHSLTLTSWALALALTAMHRDSTDLFRPNLGTIASHFGDRPSFLSH